MTIDDLTKPSYMGQKAADAIMDGEGVLNAARLDSNSDIIAFAQAQFQRAAAYALLDIAMTLDVEGRLKSR